MGGGTQALYTAKSRYNPMSATLMLFGSRWKSISMGIGQGAWEKLQETQRIELDLRDE